MTKLIAFCLAFLTSSISFAQSSNVTISSPDKSIQVTCTLDASGKPMYSVQYKGTVVLEPSQLGLVRADGDFSKALTQTGSDPITIFKDKYRLVTGKRQNNIYTANRQVIHYKNATGGLLDLI
jgi:hypothetical protein